MPILYMLIGVPASGKSTWIKGQNFNFDDLVVISTDKFIDAEAALTGKTYSEVFQSAIKKATHLMAEDLKMAIQDGSDIVWDQTNLTAKSRAGKLAQIPDTYHKIAVFFSTPDDAELRRRLDSRPGKTIPANIVMGMKSQLERPTQAEGFDQIIFV